MKESLLVTLIQICASVAGASIVWSLSIILLRDFYRKRFPATFVIGITFTCAINFAPIILIVSALEEPTAFIHSLFLLSTYMSAIAPIFGLLFVSLLRKNVITWWAFVFAIVSCSLCLLGVIPEATELIQIISPLGNLLLLSYNFPFGTFLLITGYIGNIVVSCVFLVHFLQILKIRSLKSTKTSIKMFLFFFLFGNFILVILNLLKRTNPEIAGIDSLAWCLSIGAVLLVYRRNPSIFYMIPAIINHIIITTKTGLVLSTYDCVHRVDREKEKDPTYGGQLLHTISQVLQQSLRIDAEFTTISSSKGIVMFEHGAQFSIYIVVDAYSTLWTVLLKHFADELDRLFGQFIDSQGNIANDVPDLETFIISTWEQYFPVKAN